jgi:hypothetical protein
VVVLWPCCTTIGCSWHVHDAGFIGNFCYVHFERPSTAVRTSGGAGGCLDGEGVHLVHAYEVHEAAEYEKFGGKPSCQLKPLHISPVPARKWAALSSAYVRPFSTKGDARCKPL